MIWTGFAALALAAGVFWTIQRLPGEVTWQAWPGVGYRFGNVDAVAGYRHLAWETDDGDTFEDLSFSGPMLGVKFRF